MLNTLVLAIDSVIEWGSCLLTSTRQGGAMTTLYIHNHVRLSWGSVALLMAQYKPISPRMTSHITIDAHTKQNHVAHEM